MRFWMPWTVGGAKKRGLPRSSFGFCGLWSHPRGEGGEQWAAERPMGAEGNSKDSRNGQR